MGKKTKQRQCPGLSYAIGAAECGEKRQSAIRCAADCPYNPFSDSNYSDFLEIERRVLEWIDIHGGLQAVKEAGESSFKDLRNDERVVVRAMTRTRMAMLEVRRVVDSQVIEAVDLFRPGAAAIRFADRTVASVAVRFSTMLTAVYALPHFDRPAGTGITLPNWPRFTPEEIVLQTVCHLGGPADLEGQARWLETDGNLGRLHKSITATAAARREDTLSSMKLGSVTAEFKLRAPADQCAEVLLELPGTMLGDKADFPADTARKIIFVDAPGGDGDLAGARRVLADVSIEADRLEVRALGEAQAATVRGLVEKALGSDASFIRQTTEDLTARLRASTPAFDHELVPPALRKDIDQFQTSQSLLETKGSSVQNPHADLMSEYVRHWIDESVPALDGRSPRQAAIEPRLRPILIHLVKGQIRMCDEGNLRKGGSEDINWLPKELGLVELDIPAPPPRKVPTNDDDLDGGSESWDVEPTEIPLGTITAGDAAKLLRSAGEPLETAQEAMDWLAGEGLDPVKLAEAAVGKPLNASEFSLLVGIMLPVCLMYVRGNPGWPFEEVAEKVESQTQSEMMRVVRETEITGKFDYARLADNCRQPNVLSEVVEMLLQADKSIGNKPVRPECFLAMAVFLKVLVDELDRALNAG